MNALTILVLCATVTHAAWDGFEASEGIRLLRQGARRNAQMTARRRLVRTFVETVKPEAEGSELRYDNKGVEEVDIFRNEEESKVTVQLRIWYTDGQTVKKDVEVEGPGGKLSSSYKIDGKTLRHL